MNKLTNRLQIIACEVARGESICDIGTDHGYIPIYLFNNGISPKVILADISKPSLDKAKSNCYENSSDYDWDLRLGDGLNVLQYGEVDTIIIAGMGGLLMCEILGEDLSKSHSFNKYILQPRNHIAELRAFLLKNDFTISNEQLVREGKRICEILTVINGKDKDYDAKHELDDSSFLFEFPDTLLTFKNSLTSEYLENCLSKEKSILNKKLLAKSTNASEILFEKEKIEHIISLLERL